MLTSNRIVLDASEHARAPLRGAVVDVLRGLTHAELWGSMGWLDVRQRYSRSVMGPFWVTLSLAIFVFGLGLTYGALFNMPLADYLPYLTVGVVVWTFISTVMIEGCTAFTAAEAAIKQMPAPLSVYVFRLVWRSLIVLLHNAVIVMVVLAVFGVNPGLAGLLAIPGLAILVATAVGLATILGTLSTRFRDIAPLMGNITQMLFFVSPIFWRAETLGNRIYIAFVNPFYYLIEIVRAPLLGHVPPPQAWLVAIGFAALTLVVAILLYARFRWRIPYWL